MFYKKITLIYLDHDLISIKQFLIRVIFGNTYILFYKKTKYE